jgi:hypothetical protein
MRSGDSLSLSFPDFHLIDDVAQVWIVAEGYYIPLTFFP